MNLPGTKVDTINQLNQLQIRPLYASNVRITFNKLTLQPTTTQPTTIQPTTIQPTTIQHTIDPNDLRKNKIIIGSVLSTSIFLVIISIVLFIIFFHKDYFLKIKSYFFNCERLTDDLNSEDDIDDKEIINDNHNINNNVMISINNYNIPISSNPNTKKISTLITTTTTHTTTNNSLYYNHMNRKDAISSPHNNIKNNKNASESTNSSSSFLLNHKNNNINDELDLYYKNESFEKFRYKLQTYLHLFGNDDKNDNEAYNEDDNTIISYIMTNVLLMNENDCIQILNTIGCYIVNNHVKINEFELEANMLYKSYHWLKRNK